MVGGINGNILQYSGAPPEVDPGDGSRASSTQVATTLSGVGNTQDIASKFLQLSADKVTEEKTASKERNLTKYTNTESKSFQKLYAKMQDKGNEAIKQAYDTMSIDGNDDKTAKLYFGYDVKNKPDNIINVYVFMSTSQPLCQQPPVLPDKVKVRYNVIAENDIAGRITLTGIPYLMENNKSTGEKTYGLNVMVKYPPVEASLAEKNGVLEVALVFQKNTNIEDINQIFAATNTAFGECNGPVKLLLTMQMEKMVDYWRDNPQSKSLSAEILNLVEKYKAMFFR